MKVTDTIIISIIITFTAFTMTNLYFTGKIKSYRTRFRLDALNIGFCILTLITIIICSLISALFNI